MKAIKVTIENKKYNPKHLQNEVVGSFKLFSKLPVSWNNMMPYNTVTVGFKEVVYPELLENQARGEMYLDKDKNIATYQVIDIPPLTAEEAKQLVKQQTKQRYENHKANGWEAYQNFRANIIADIDSEILTEPQAFAIEDLLNVGYDKISASGDWKTAYYKLSQVTIPQGYEFVQPYYNTAMQELETYITENYE